MITAKIIQDSINPNDKRLTSWILKYPRFIHSELMTHRVFSRNAASSRAIPIKKMIDDIRANPAMPTHFGLNERGMQATKEASEQIVADAKRTIGIMMETCIAGVGYLEDMGLHKQVANRYLEPWMHIETLVSATEFENWFALRDHVDAEPHIRDLAAHMLELYNGHTPQSAEFGAWHIPFGDKMPEGSTLEQKLGIATARSARLSYSSFDGAMNAEKDFILHDSLRDGGHWSAFEHCAQATEAKTGNGNFNGWKPYRKCFPFENRTDSRVIAKRFDSSNITLRA